MHDPKSAAFQWSCIEVKGWEVSILPRSDEKNEQLFFFFFLKGRSGYSCCGLVVSTSQPSGREGWGSPESMIMNLRIYMRKQFHIMMRRRRSVLEPPFSLTF